MADRTLALIKPDALLAGRAPAIEALIEKHAFAVLARSEQVLSSEQVAELYECYECDVDFFTALTEELTSGPSIVMVLEKKDGLAAWLELLGPEDATVAAREAPLSVRGMFGSSRIKNAAHGSQTPAAALRELKLFFPRVFPRESTICVVMPSASPSTDAIKAFVAGDGFLVVASKTVELDVEQAESFYSDLKGKPEFDERVSKITSGPVTVLALEKSFAVESLIYLLGPVGGTAPGTLRTRFGDIHGSESLSAAARESRFFFGDLLTTPSQTFAWIKPDAFESADAILAEAEAAGFTIIASEVHLLNSKLVYEVYDGHISPQELTTLTELMISGPSLALVLARPCAITAWRSLIGPTNSAEAKSKYPYSLRAKFGTDSSRNACHGSDSVEAFEREARLLFPSLFTTESTLAILTPDAAPHMEQIMSAIKEAGLVVTDKCVTTLTTHRANDLLMLLGPEMPPFAPEPPPVDLFISAFMEGGKSSRYLQIYNPGEHAAALDGYALAVKYAKDDAAKETWPLLRFGEGNFVPAGGVFVMYHPDCSDSIKAALPADGRCSQPQPELPGGGDSLALVALTPGVEAEVVEGEELPYTVIDCIGVFNPTTDFSARPWQVAGVRAATKDGTLIRKATVATGNPVPWDGRFESSQGTNEANSEWFLLPKDVVSDPAHGWTLASWPSTPPPPPPPPQGTFEATMAHLTSAASVVLVLTGKGAIFRWNALLGPVDPTIAKVRCPSCLRARYGTDATKNVGLGSLNALNAFQEIKFFFPKALIEPIPSTKLAKDYVAEVLTPTLTAGLVELCRTKPNNPVEWLGKWLMANNPNLPIKMD